MTSRKAEYHDGSRCGHSGACPHQPRSMNSPRTYEAQGDALHKSRQTPCASQRPNIQHLDLLLLAVHRFGVCTLVFQLHVVVIPAREHEWTKHDYRIDDVAIFL